MADRAELSAYAYKLGDLLRELYGCTVSDRFVQQFISEALRLGSSDYEDLGQLVLLECQDLLSQHDKISDQSLGRIVHRIRQRLARRARREMQVDPTLLVQRRAHPVEQPSASLSEAGLRQLIDALSPDEAIVLHFMVFEGRTPRDIASVLGVSLATVYRRLDAAKRHIMKLVG